MTKYYLDLQNAQDIVKLINQRCLDAITENEFKATFESPCYADKLTSLTNLPQNELGNVVFGLISKGMSTQYWITFQDIVLGTDPRLTPLNEVFIGSIEKDVEAAKAAEKAAGLVEVPTPVATEITDVESPMSAAEAYAAYMDRLTMEPTGAVVADDVS